MFKNTPIVKHDECGRTYAACGGEAVTNMGLRAVKCILPSEQNNAIHKSLNFQVGDLVTRGLLSVSQLCSMGAGVWCGPAPEYKSYIVWDRNCFIASAGPKTELFIKKMERIICLCVKSLVINHVVRIWERLMLVSRGSPPIWGTLWAPAVKGLGRFRGL